MNNLNLGKWKYDKDEGDWLVMDDGFSIIAIVKEESDIDPEKAARLIAAAPELLDFAMHVKSCILKNGEYAPISIQLVHELIAKATGESA